MTARQSVGDDDAILHPGLDQRRLHRSDARLVEIVGGPALPYVQIPLFLGTQRAQLSAPDKLTPFDEKASTGTLSAVAPSEDATQRARENLILVLINHHEFVTVR